MTISPGVVGCRVHGDKERSECERWCFVGRVVIVVANHNRPYSKNKLVFCVCGLLALLYSIAQKKNSDDTLSL